MAANNRIPITVGDRVDTSTLFFERTEQHGLLVAAQAVWKGPLGSGAAREDNRLSNSSFLWTSDVERAPLPPSPPVTLPRALPRGIRASR